MYNHPKERAKDILDAFADLGIQGVIATIGGNDQIRILKHLDPAVLQSNPTRFYGMSDNTHLANYLWTLGISSFYGGHLIPDFAVDHPYTESFLTQALFDDPSGDLASADEFTDHDPEWGTPDDLLTELESNPGWLWRGGEQQIKGRTWGGNLEILYQLLAADRYLPEADALDGIVLLLETSEEVPSDAVVRRALLALGERGLFSRFSAVVVGRAKTRSYHTERSANERQTYRESQRDVITDVVTEYNETAPIIFDVDFGHTNPVTPIPYGQRVHIDPSQQYITLR